MPGESKAMNSKKVGSSSGSIMCEKHTQNFWFLIGLQDDKDKKKISPTMPLVGQSKSRKRHVQRSGWHVHTLDKVLSGQSEFQRSRGFGSWVEFVDRSSK